MSDSSRLETLVQSGLRIRYGGERTDTEYAILSTRSGPETNCAGSLLNLLTVFYPKNLPRQSEDILTWYRQSADFQDMTRILNALLLKKEESDG